MNIPQQVFSYASSLGGVGLSGGVSGVGAGGGAVMAGAGGVSPPGGLGLYAPRASARAAPRWVLEDLGPINRSVSGLSLGCFQGGIIGPQLFEA